MYYDRFFPFYVAYANPALYDGERIQEQEFALMKSYYPEAAGRIQVSPDAFIYFIIRSIPSVIRIPTHPLCLWCLLNTLFSFFPRRKQPVSLHLYSAARICKTDQEHPAGTPADLHLPHKSV